MHEEDSSDRKISNGLQFTIFLFLSLTPVCAVGTRPRTYDVRTLSSVVLCPYVRSRYTAHSTAARAAFDRSIDRCSTVMSYGEVL